MKIYDGEKPIKAHRCLIYGGESESPRMEIHGGEITKIKRDALNEMTIEGCPKRNDSRGNAPNEKTVGGCPKRNDSGGMPQTK